MDNYDSYASQYDATVVSGGPVTECAYRFVLKQIGQGAGAQVCDIGCGQGELARRIVKMGARVTGVDVSTLQLNIARSYGETTIRWVRDDARTLSQMESESCDVAVCNLMLMDTPDFPDVLASACRILKIGGQLIVTLTHPCFQSPYSETMQDEAGVYRHRLIKDYSADRWFSSGKGTIRGTVGAYHRSISAYLNEVVKAGFAILRMEEPVADARWIAEERQLIHTMIPPVLGIVARKS